MTTHPPETKVRFSFGRRRYIDPGVVVHESVNQRIALNNGYNPPNVPAVRTPEPWVRWNQGACVAV
jgi:hypothetical protein